MTPLAIALIVLVAMFLLGLPIFMSLIISSVVAILAGGDILPLSVIHNSLFDGLNLFPLLAIPCFVVAGTLMEFGNITQQIVDVVKQLVGRVYGGLGITTILACTFFAAISGIGRLSLPHGGHGAGRHLPCIPPSRYQGGKAAHANAQRTGDKPLVHRQAAFRQTARRFALGRVRREPPQRKTDHPHGPEPAGS